MPCSIYSPRLLARVVSSQKNLGSPKDVKSNRRKKLRTNVAFNRWPGGHFPFGSFENTKVLHFESVPGGISNGFLLTAFPTLPVKYLSVFIL